MCASILYVLTGIFKIIARLIGFVDSSAFVSQVRTQTHVTWPVSPQEQSQAGATSSEFRGQLHLPDFSVIEKLSCSEKFLISTDIFTLSCSNWQGPPLRFFFFCILDLFFIFILCLHGYTCTYSFYVCNAQCGLKNSADFPDLELQTVVSCHVNAAN